MLDRSECDALAGYGLHEAVLHGRPGSRRRACRTELEHRDNGQQLRRRQQRYWLLPACANQKHSLVRVGGHCAGDL